MKMIYQYIRIEQIHSVAQVPKRWSYPIKLLLSLKKVDPFTELAITPTDDIVSPEIEAMEIIRGREY